MVFFLWMMSFFKIVNPETGMTQAFPELEDFAMKDISIPLLSVSET